MQATRARVLVAAAMLVTLGLLVTPSVSASSPLHTFHLEKTCDAFGTCTVFSSNAAPLPLGTTETYFGPQFGDPVLSSRVLITSSFGSGGTAVGHCAWPHAPRRVRARSRAGQVHSQASTPTSLSRPTPTSASSSGTGTTSSRRRVASGEHRGSPDPAQVWHSAQVPSSSIVWCFTRNPVRDWMRRSLKPTSRSSRSTVWPQSPQTM